MEQEEIPSQHQQQQNSRQKRGEGRLPGWGVCGEMLLIDFIKSNKVLHAPHIQVNQNNVFHRQTSAFQLF